MQRSRTVDSCDPVKRNFLLKRWFKCVALVIAGVVVAVSVNSETAAASQRKTESASMPLPLKVVGTQILAGTLPRYTPPATAEKSSESDEDK